MAAKVAAVAAASPNRVRRDLSVRPPTEHNGTPVRTTRRPQCCTNAPRSRLQPAAFHLPPSTFRLQTFTFHHPPPPQQTEVVTTRSVLTNQLAATAIAMLLQAGFVQVPPQLYRVSMEIVPEQMLFSRDKAYENILIK